MSGLSPVIHQILERRSRVRFPLQLDMYYRPAEREQNLAIEGKTINLSSAGLLFHSSALPGLGDKVEITVDWPLNLNAVCKIKLVVRGQVMRVTENSAAIKVVTYEFRTKRLTSPR